MDQVPVEPRLPRHVAVNPARVLTQTRIGKQGTHVLVPGNLPHRGPAGSALHVSGRVAAQPREVRVRISHPRRQQVGGRRGGAFSRHGVSGLTLINRHHTNECVRAEMRDSPERPPRGRMVKPPAAPQSLGRKAPVKFYVALASAITTVRCLIQRDWSLYRWDARPRSPRIRWHAAENPSCPALTCCSRGHHASLLGADSDPPGRPFSCPVPARPGAGVPTSRCSPRRAVRTCRDHPSVFRHLPRPLPSCLWTRRHHLPDHSHSPGGQDHAFGHESGAVIPIALGRQDHAELPSLE